MRINVGRHLEAEGELGSCLDQKYIFMFLFNVCVKN